MKPCSGYLRVRLVHTPSSNSTYGTGAMRTSDKAAKAKLAEPAL